MKKIILLLIPVIVIVNIQLNYNVKFWENRTDPEYAYLLNGLNLAFDYGNIGHIDHPGTTVQVFSAVIIKTTFCFRKTEHDMRTDVLLNPEIYLSTIAWTFSLFNCLILFFLGHLIYRMTNEIEYGLLFQAISVMSITTLSNAFYRISPEPLLFGAVSILVMLFLSKFYFYKTWGRVYMNHESITKVTKIIDIDLLIILMAVLIGYCFATKINSLPLIILPLLMVTNRNKVLFLCIVFIMFIIFTLPISNQYLTFLNWVLNIVTHSGHYGTGEKNMIDVQTMSNNFYLFVKHEGILFFTLVLSFVFIIREWFRKQFGTSFKMLLLIFVVQITFLIMVLKHFEYHYFVPIYPTIAINLFLIFELTKISKKIRLVLIYSAISIFAFVHLFLQDDILSFNKPICKKGLINIYSYTCHSPIYALKFGDDYASHANNQVLRRVYGKQYFYDLWSKDFYEWNQEVSIDSLLKEPKEVVYYGDKASLMISHPEIKLDYLSNNIYQLSIKR